MTPLLRKGHHFTGQSSWAILFYRINLLILMEKKEQTIQTYNKSAGAMAKKFNDIGVRTEDIKRGFSLVKKDNPKIIEIGCGNGREAKEILKYTNDYLGIDISGEFIKIAKRENPGGDFEVADVEDFSFPKNVDIVFSFASLLHSDKDNVKRVLDRAYESLNNEGIFYISLKYGNYSEKTVEDEFGIRTYYFYTPELIKELAGNRYKDVYTDRQDLRGEKWFTVVLKK